MKKMLFFSLFAVIVIALASSCNKEDDPYNPPTPAEDSIWVMVDYTVSTDYVGSYTMEDDKFYLTTYNNGECENFWELTKGVPFIMKGEAFNVHFLGREIEISCGDISIGDGVHSIPATNWSPANPGRVKVEKNMKFTYTPVITFTKWW